MVWSWGRQLLPWQKAPAARETQQQQQQQHCLASTWRWRGQMQHMQRAPAGHKGSQDTQRSSSHSHLVVCECVEACLRLCTQHLQPCSDCLQLLQTAAHNTQQRVVPAASAVVAAVAATKSRVCSASLLHYYTCFQPNLAGPAASYCKDMHAQCGISAFNGYRSKGMTS
jgi:hypothetical protein